MKHRKKRIAFAWGWTGGHVYPIQSLIFALDTNPLFFNNTEKVYRFGTKWELEHTVFQAIQTNNITLDFVHTYSGKLRRETKIISIRKNILASLFFVSWFFTSLYYLTTYRIDIVFCKWWHVALPVVLAARLVGIALYVHESDTSPGLVNRIANTFSTKTYTWFDSVFPWAQTVWQILSDTIAINEEKAMEVLQEIWHTTNKNDVVDQILSGQKTVIFVSWWSQWSHTIHTTLSDILQKNKNMQSDIIFCIIVWFINTQDIWLFEAYDNVLVLSYATQQQMAALYYRSDIGILRAWTTTLAEATLHRLLLCIVPLAITHDQQKNAQWYKLHHNAWVFSQQKKTFAQHLEKTILQHKAYKKPKKHQPLIHTIEQAKNSILHDMLW